MYRHLGLGGVSPLFCFSASLAFAQSCSDCNAGVQWARGSCTCLWWSQGERRPPSPLSNVPGSLVGSRSVRLTARDTTKTRTCRTWRKSSASVASAWRRSYIASCTRGTSCMPWRAKVRCPLSWLQSVQRASAHVGRELPVAGFVFRARVPHSRGSGDETETEHWGWGGGKGGGQAGRGLGLAWA